MRGSRAPERACPPHPPSPKSWQREATELSATFASSLHVLKSLPAMPNTLKSLHSYVPRFLKSSQAPCAREERLRAIFSPCKACKLFAPVGSMQAFCTLFQNFAIVFAQF